MYLRYLIILSISIIIFILLDESALDDCPKIDDSASILQLALLRVLRVANGLSGLNDDEDSSEGDGVDPEIWAPASLFRALRAHRWVINTDEQDAHEFFQVSKLYENFFYKFNFGK